MQPYKDFKPYPKREKFYKEPPNPWTPERIQQQINRVSADISDRNKEINGLQSQLSVIKNRIQVLSYQMSKFTKYRNLLKNQLEEFNTTKEK